MSDLVDYCKITGKFQVFVGDTNKDEDDYPEFETPTGTGTLTPSAKMIKFPADPTTGSDNKFVYPTPISVTIDKDGYLSYNGKPYVYILAPDSRMNPPEFHYTISMNLSHPSLGSTTWGPYVLTNMVAGETYDLFGLAQGEASSSVLITRGKSLYESAVSTGLFRGTEEEFVLQYMSGGAGTGGGVTVAEDPQNPGLYMIV